MTNAQKMANNMSKNYKVSDLILFLTFLQDEMKIKEIYFIHCAKDPIKDYFEFMVMENSNDKKNVHCLKVDESGIDEAFYFPPDYSKNPKQITRFREWLRGQ